MQNDAHPWLVTGVASPNGPGGPGAHQFLRFSKVKAYVGPTIFLVKQGPIIIGPHQFQKRDYTPDRPLFSGHQIPKASLHL